MTKVLGPGLILLLFTCGCALRQTTGPNIPPSRGSDLEEERSRQESRPLPAPLGGASPSASRQQLVREIDSALGQATNNVSMLQARTPSPERQRGIARVESLIIQARDARTANDLLNARTLAERAYQLSQDFLRSQ